MQSEGGELLITVRRPLWASRWGTLAAVVDTEKSLTSYSG
jgi:hypothetical protein